MKLTLWLKTFLRLHTFAEEVRANTLSTNKNFADIMEFSKTVAHKLKEHEKVCPYLREFNVSQESEVKK